MLLIKQTVYFNLVIVCAAFSFPENCFGQESEFSSSDIDFFEKKVRPLLVDHCLECHGAENDKIRGGLRLTSRAAILEGGDSGAAAVPGHPDQSLLVDSIEYELYEMPPTGKLSDEQIAVFKKWIKMGIPDPRSAQNSQPGNKIDIENGKQFWAFQSVNKKTAIPAKNPDDDWAVNEVDRFLLASMHENQLRPSKDADRYTLLRRLHLILTGVPPNVKQLQEFASSNAPLKEDIARVVDELLESESFGQRWGRHWLDVARFAESSGGGRSLMFPEAWRYRDYVIESFNEDKSFDRFIREQIAGDLLPYENQSQRNENVTATGFLALGPTNYEQQDKQLLEMEVIDEQIDTVGRAFLGLTLGCARCHDHKFDPIPISDYYGLVGIFKNTRSLVPGNVSSYVKTALATKESIDAFNAYQKRVAALNNRLKNLKKEKSKTADNKSNKAQEEYLDAQIKELVQKIRELKKSAPPAIQHAMSVTDQKQIKDSHIHIRGGVRNIGPIVPRGFVSVLCDTPLQPLPTDSSGRLELANWIANDKNPLTARVYVNRVWRHVFGKGIVSTPDNFGTMGRRPTHPELLDYLAQRFTENGWSTKKLIRELVLSRAFRMTAGTAPATDPENKYLSRFNRQRVEAEILRDSILAISGQLDKKHGGLTIRKITQYDLGYKFNTKRRSVYVPAFRNSMLDLFETFDMANPNLVVGNRNSSTLPTQALFLMNNPFVIENSDISAARLLASKEPDYHQLINEAYLRVLNRMPTEAELTIAQNYVAENSKSGQTCETALAGLFHSLFASIEFRYIN